jgi:methyltransferase (TIGR00027 family)
MHLFHYGSCALYADWLAWPLVGAPAEAIAQASPQVLGERQRPFITWFAARARITEDWLAASAAQQYLILGAGLDSFAWRQNGNLRVIEVDHPQCQAWKRKRIAALELPTPDDHVWVPFDFEEPTLRQTLDSSGIDRNSPLFVSWLGVIPYLTRDAIIDSLNQLPACELAVTYVPPEEHWDIDAKPIGKYFAARVRERGEPWRTLLTTEQLVSLLSLAGFTLLEDLGALDIDERYGLPTLHHERIALASKPRATDWLA